MINIVISGYGKMGHMVEEAAAKYPGQCRVVLCSEDIQSVEASVAQDAVCIDFTTPDAFRANYKCIAEKFKAAVVGTTGWNDIRDEVVSYFEKCGTTLVYSSNFSIGVNVLFAASERAAALLEGKGYECSITETHHIHKKDAPSGTAKTLAGIVASSMNCPEPQITSIREGEVPGIHTLEMTSYCDRLTFTHEAFSREGFAAGAIVAALACVNLTGVHEFKDIILK